MEKRKLRKKWHICSSTQNLYSCRKQNKGRTPKKIKAFVFTNLNPWSFLDKNRNFNVFFHLLCIQHAKKYIEPLHNQKWTKTQKVEHRKQWAHQRRLRNTKKCKLLYREKSENKIKAEHKKKFKLLCLRSCTRGFFEIKITALMCSSTFST